MCIKSWHIALIGATLCFIFPFYMAILSFTGPASLEGTVFSGFISIIFFIPAIVMLIPAVFLKSKTKKKIGAIISIIFGTTLLTIWHLLAIGRAMETNVLFNNFLISLPGILLFIAGILFFGKENKSAQLCRKKLIIFMIFLLSMVIFAPSALIILLVDFDSNPEIKKCQYESAAPAMIVAALKNVSGMERESYQQQINLECYKMIARKNLDSELCERLPDSGPGNRNKGDCLDYIASKKNDSSICLKTDNAAYCYLGMAISGNNPAFCEKSGDGKDFCYRKLAANIQDPYLCEKISNSSYQKTEGYCKAISMGCYAGCDKLNEAIAREKCVTGRLEGLLSSYGLSFSTRDELNAVGETFRKETIGDYCQYHKEIKKE